jgi:hypothetical protein
MNRAHQGGSMAAQPTSPLRAGQVLEISFPAFTPRITINSDRELTVEIVAGKYIGFSDTVDYEAVALRNELIFLSWQEHNGSTIVHALDLACHTACTAVAPADGGFVRMMGRIEVESDT